MIGIELLDPNGSPATETTKKIQSEALKKDLLILACGCCKNVVRFMAPFNVTEKEIDQAVSIIGSVMSQL